MELFCPNYKNPPQYSGNEKHLVYLFTTLEKGSIPITLDKQFSLQLLCTEEIVFVQLGYSDHSGYSRTTGTVFLERDIAVDLFQCCEHHKQNSSQLGLATETSETAI